MPVARACPGLLASEVWPLTLPTGVREGSAVLRWHGGGPTPSAASRRTRARRPGKKTVAEGADGPGVLPPFLMCLSLKSGSIRGLRAAPRKPEREFGTICLSGDSGYLGTVHFHTWAPRSWAPSEPGAWFSARLESGWHHWVLVNRSRHRLVVNSQSSRQGRGAQGLRYPARWPQGSFLPGLHPCAFSIRLARTP